MDLTDFLKEPPLILRMIFLFVSILLILALSLIISFHLLAKHYKVSSREEHSKTDSSKQKVFIIHPATKLVVQDPSTVPSLSQNELLSTKK